MGSKIKTASSAALTCQTCRSRSALSAARTATIISRPMGRGARVWPNPLGLDSRPVAIDAGCPGLKPEPLEGLMLCELLGLELC